MQTFKIKLSGHTFWQLCGFCIAGRRSTWPFEMGEFKYSTQMAQPESFLWPTLTLTFHLAVQISEVLIPPLIGPATSRSSFFSKNGMLHQPEASDLVPNSWGHCDRIQLTNQKSLAQLFWGEQLGGKQRWLSSWGVSGKSLSKPPKTPHGCNGLRIHSGWAGGSF